VNLWGKGLLERMLSIGVVVLAAGRAERMGRRPKSLLRLDGQSLIARQLRMLQSLEVDSIVVVLGHYADVIEKEIAGFGVRCVNQTGDLHDQPSSLNLGLTALSDDLDAYLVTPADLPLLRASDYRAVLNAYAARSEGSRFVAPSVAGKPGNPVVFDGFIRGQILEGLGGFGSGRWRQHSSALIEDMVTSNSRYVVDVDTEQDIAALNRDYGIELHW